MAELSVAIVDDNPIILNTLDEILKNEDGLSVIGKAENGEEAINMIKDKTPDVVLLDLIMPKIDGISVVERVQSEHPAIKNPAFIEKFDTRYRTILFVLNLECDKLGLIAFYIIQTFSRKIFEKMNNFIFKIIFVKNS